MKKLILILTSVLLTFGLTAQSAEEIIKKIEGDMFPDSMSEIRLDFVDEDGDEENYEMTVHTKDVNRKVIVRFTAPTTSIGHDLIMLEKNVWSYDPKTRRTIKVPSNLSFGGTGFSYGDVVRLNYSDNYIPEFIDENDTSWTIELKAKERNAPYFRIELDVLKPGIISQGRCYDRNGNLIKLMHYSDVQTINGVEKPLVLTVTSPDAPGDVTVMTQISEVDKDYPDRIFNKRNLAAHFEDTY